MAKYFLGVDIGATKSHALIADETGQALALGVGGAGNYEVVGYQGLATILNDITNKALTVAGHGLLEMGETRTDLEELFLNLTDGAAA